MKMLSKAVLNTGPSLPETQHFITTFLVLQAVFNQFDTFNSNWIHFLNSISWDQVSSLPLMPNIFRNNNISSVFFLSTLFWFFKTKTSIKFVYYEKLYKSVLFVANGSNTPQMFIYLPSQMFYYLSAMKFPQSLHLFDKCLWCTYYRQVLRLFRPNSIQQWTIQRLLFCETYRIVFLLLGCFCYTLKLLSIKRRESSVWLLTINRLPGKGLWKRWLK